MAGVPSSAVSPSPREARPPSLLDERLRRRYRRVVAVALVAALVSLVFFDRRLSAWLASPDSPRREIAKLVTDTLRFGHVGPVMVLLALWAWVTKRRPLRRWMLFGILTMATAGAVTNILKFLIGRSRPERSEGGLSPFNLNAGWQSFPSGHATDCGALFMVVWLMNRKWGWRVALPVCIVFAFSRVPAGAHWLSDVIAGFVVGMSVTLALQTVCVHIETAHPIRRKRWRVTPRRIVAKVKRAFDPPLELRDELRATSN